MRPVLLTLLTLLTALAARPALAGTPLVLGGGYHGDTLSHPGAYFELGTRIAQAGPFSVRLGADLGVYHHERNHTGAFGRALFASRFSTGSGFFVEPRFALGYLHTWVDGDEFWVQDSETGQLRTTSNTGDANVTWGMDLGLGWELSRTGLPLTFVVRPGLHGRAPYNNFTLTQFSLQAGVQWQFGGSR